jgi:uncharacterized protein
MCDDFFTRTSLSFMSTESLALAAVVFLVAGWVKGLVGMGLPTVAMGALALAMPPAQAAALLVLPSLVTNVWQLLAGPALVSIARRLALVMLFVCLGTGLGIGFLTQSSSRWPSLLLGAVLASYSLLGLYVPRLAIPRAYEYWLGPVVGATTGVLTGATGVFVVPAVPYLSALGLTKDELIKALGLSFTVSTLALAAGLAASGSFPGGLAATSLAAVIPALVGMFLGQAVRSRLDPTSFRKRFFRAILLIGVYMVLRAAIANEA